jgi:signal transduction histidine kinase
MVDELPKLPTRVLVVDDQPSMRLLMRMLLERDGCEVVEAADGVDALEQIANQQIDVVVMDVMMPRMDGIATCRKLREVLGNRTLPVVLVTALADREARIAGKGAGADDFLTKPIDPVELCARVRVLRRSKAFHDQLANEQKRLSSELTEAQDAVARLERLATLGTLAAGVGHELKNLAQVVHGVRQELVEAPFTPESGAVLDHVGRHLESLGQNLMRLGNAATGDPGPVDVAQVVSHVHDLMLRAGRFSGLSVTVRVDVDEVFAHANAIELEQVMINLIGNAVDAVDGCAVREIGIEVDPLPVGVRIRVTDTGRGMTPGVLERVFERYFTTKGPGKGTGLGLPVVHQRVTSWGGTVVLRSTDGEGTVAEVELQAPSSVASQRLVG